MTISGVSEEKIIEGCKKNDRKSQELLYKHFAKKMYSICISYAGDRALAQDMLQIAFIKVFKNINSYKNDGSFEGWIRKIVTNTAIDHIRNKKRTNDFIEEEPRIPESHTYNQAPKTIAYNEVMEQVARLPKGARIVFNMYAVDGYTHKEIAKKLDITEGTSKSQFNRARKMLMDFIGNVNI